MNALWAPLTRRSPRAVSAVADSQSARREVKHMTTEELTKDFPIISFCRADLQTLFTDEEIALLDDADMGYIARKMADAYCDGSLWIDLEITAKDVLDSKKAEPA